MCSCFHRNLILSTFFLHFALLRMHLKVLSISVVLMWNFVFCINLFGIGIYTVRTSVTIFKLRVIEIFSLASRHFSFKGIVFCSRTSYFSKVLLVFIQWLFFFDLTAALSNTDATRSRLFHNWRRFSNTALQFHDSVGHFSWLGG